MQEIADIKDTLKDFSHSSYFPKINKTVCLSSTLHNNFDKMIFGFTGSGGQKSDGEDKSQNVQFINFVLTFIK